MKTADIFKFIVKPSRTTIALVCMLSFHAVSAKSEAPSSDNFNQSSGLNLALPDPLLNKPKELSSQFIPSADNFQQNTQDQDQLIISQKKKTPVNVNCGMNMFQNVTADTPLANRLTGECDLKYHY